MLAYAIAAVLLASAQSVPAAPAANAPLDVETRLNGVDIACTGIGLEARADPRWGSYGVRIELSNSRNEYLSDGVITLRDGSGRPLLSARCDAPWLLLRLPPGRYSVEATLPDAAPRSSAFIAPRTGQLRVVLQFKDL
jgi:hypothetical protein